MEKDLMIRGFYRLSKLMQDMIRCEDKQELIRLSTSFLNDTGDLIAMLYVENGVEQDDVEKYNKEIDNVENEATELNDGEATEGATTSVVEEQKPPVERLEE